MRLIFLLFLFLLGAGLPAQQYKLFLRDAESGKALKLNYSHQSSSEAERLRNLNKSLEYYRERGHLTARADTMIMQGDTMVVSILKGPVYTWTRLYNINVDEGALGSSGYRERLYRNQPLNYKQSSNLLKKLLTYYENHGYPFASLRLDSISQEGESLKAGIRVDKGAQYKIDSVSAKGTARINQRYLYNYIGIKPGDLYNEALVREIETRIRELPFVEETRPTDVFLLDELAIIRLYLNNRKASNFSGIIGFLPNNQQTGKLLLTGEVTLNLRNVLGRGESINLEWRRLQALTQSLNAGAAIPFVFNTDFGVAAALDLYKKDTSFLNLRTNIGLQYLMKGTDYLKVYVENRSSNLLSTAGLENVTVLPDYADIRNTMYGLELFYTRLDYRFNPRKGIKALVRAGVGNRNVRVNENLNPDLYKDVALRDLQYSAHVDLDFFVPIGRRSTFTPGFLGSALIGSSFFENELSRIGGVNTLRGFDEESIFASKYGVLNLEYRYLLEENSFLFLFANGAWYENRAVNRNVEDLPYGVGAGMSFQTKAGIFALSYALGSQFGVPLEFRTAKVHFGLSSLF